MYEHHYGGWINLYLKHQNIKIHLDAELSLEARMIASFLIERIDHNHLPHIQSKINRIMSYAI